MPSREDTFICTVSVTSRGETRKLGTFDTFAGGETKSDDTKYYRGGLAQQESLGGRRMVDNVTVGRLYDAYMQEQEPWLSEGTGRADVVVTKQPTDDDGNAFGRPRIYTGKLIQVTPPGHDSQSSNEAKIELIVSPTGTIGS